MSGTEMVQPLVGRSENVFVANVPGSKSYTNRALIVASSGLGKTRIHNALKSQDTMLLAEALARVKGLSVQEEGDGFLVDRTADVLEAADEPLYVGGGGTPGRFLLSFATTIRGKTVVSGNERLSERPMGDLLDAFTEMGVEWRCLGRPMCLPVEIEGGRITETQWRVSGAVSSQFLSSLLLLAGQMRHLPRVSVTVPGHLLSKPYVEMTLSSLRAAGIGCEHDGYRTFSVRPGKMELADIIVEADASAMSYFLVAAAITRTRVRINGLGKDSRQGDVGLALALEEMGCQVQAGGDFIELAGRDLQGIDIDMESMPDTVLSLAIAACQAKGLTHVTHIGNLRVKECDRIHAISTELRRLGYRANEAADAVSVWGGGAATPAMVHTYDDHRVAMSFGLLSLLYEGITVENPDCVAKSFPGFWTELRRFCEHHDTKRERTSKCVQSKDSVS